jgi:hypothetical protein
MIQNKVKYTFTETHYNFSSIKRLFFLSQPLYLNIITVTSGHSYSDLYSDWNSDAVNLVSC